MLLKVIIVLLFIAVLISLSSALVFLMKDVGNSRKRILYALGVRIVLAVALVGTITWGIYSGQLTSPSSLGQTTSSGTCCCSVFE